MKVATHIKFHFPFEYWIGVLTNDPLGNAAIEYQAVRDDKGLVIPMAGDTVALLTTEPMQVGGLVRGLTDRDGTPIFTVGGEAYDMYVQSCIPQLDPFSRIIGYRHNLKSTPPRDTAALLQSIADSV